MIKTGKLVRALIVAALAATATPYVKAQFPAPPPLPGEQTAPQIPKRDAAAEVAKMTKRYGLSDDQAKKISTILEDHARKAEDIAKDDSLLPPERLHQLMSTREDEIKLVSEAMTPEQRKKYEADVHPSSLPQRPSDGEAAPSATN